jgi:hypothetical protein
MVITVLAALITGCATPAERAAAVQRDVEDMIQVYGPGCEKLGYKADTDAWRDCVLRLATKESIDRYRLAPATTSCIGHRGFFQCSTL